MNQSTGQSRIPRINEPAPDFQAKSTHGVIRLSDYTGKGRWVLLFSHPADFTPVCTTEFVEFARNHAEFEKRNVQLIGVSVDSVYSHIAWARNIEEHFGVKIEFPVVADLDQKVATGFGLVHEAVSDTAAVRAVFARNERTPQCPTASTSSRALTCSRAVRSHGCGWVALECHSVRSWAGRAPLHQHWQPLGCGHRPHR